MGKPSYLTVQQKWVSYICKQVHVLCKRAVKSARYNKTITLDIKKTCNLQKNLQKTLQRRGEYFLKLMHQFPHNRVIFTYSWTNECWKSAFSLKIVSFQTGYTVLISYKNNCQRNKKQIFKQLVLLPGFIYITKYDEGIFGHYLDFP